MSPELSSEIIASSNINAALVLADGKCFFGSGVGKRGLVIGEICFNTAMTGYQEILTDPSYSGQIITFTYPHIGNTGCNDYDNESIPHGARGLVLRNPITRNSNYRSNIGLNDWLVKRGLTGIAGVDTRALTRYIKKHGAQNAALLFVDSGTKISIQALLDRVKPLPTLLGQELALQVSSAVNLNTHQQFFDLAKESFPPAAHLTYKVVALDFGIKQNILHALTSVGLDVVRVSAKTSFPEIMALKPDGVFLSNGPGDPEATAAYAVPVIRQLLDASVPIFGICLGHQLLCLASGLKTIKMEQGHRGANHPVKHLVSGKVEITSQNHGFCADDTQVPNNIEVTHRSLFDQGIEGIRRRDKPAYSVQYHPESSPGPHDSRYLFSQFVQLIQAHKEAALSLKDHA